MLVTGISGDQADIHRESFSLDRACRHAASPNFIEHPAERTALAEPSMPVLRECGVVRNGILQAQTAEPTMGQIQMHFLTQAAFGTDAIAVADDEHADHQLRIDGGTTCGALEISQMRAQPVQVKTGVNTAQEMVLWNVVFKVE